MEKLLEAVLECDSICLGVFDNVGYDLKKITDNLVADRVKPTLSNIAEEIFYKGKNEFWDAYGKAIHDREQKQIALKGIQGREAEHEQLQKEIDELLTLCPDEDMDWSCDGGKISYWFKCSTYEEIYRKYMSKEISEIEKHMGFRFKGGDGILKVYAYKTGWNGILEIEDTQKAIKDFVGGPLEEIKIADGFIAICNEDAFIENLPNTAMFLGEGDGEAMDERGINYVMQGNFLVCRCSEGDGKHLSITDEDVKLIRHYLKPVDRMGESVMTVG